MRVRFSLIVWLLFSILPLASWAEETLTVGVFSYRPAQVMQVRWQPFEAYMTEALPGYKVKVLPLPQDKMEVALKNNQIDILFTTPPHFLALREEMPLVAMLATLVRVHNDVPVNTLGGVIFRLKSRDDIQSLKDLKGKTIAAMGTSYLGGYISQAIEITEEGLLLDDLNFSFVGSPHDEVFTQVLTQKADVGFVRTGLIEQLIAEGVLNLDQIEIINRQNLPGYPFIVSTHLYPEWPMVALPHLSSDLTRQISAALLAIDSKSQIARNTGIYGFSVPSSLLHLIEPMKRLRLAPFDKAPVLTFDDIWQQYKLPIYLVAAMLAMFVYFLALLIHRNRQIEGAHKQLDKQNEFQYTLMRTLPGLVFFKDTEGVFQFANQVVERLYNAPQGVLGKTDYEFVDKAVADEFRRLDKAAEDSDVTTMNEEWLTFPNGEKSLYQTYKTPVKNRFGEVLGILGLGHDITLQRSNEHSLKLAATVFENTREGVVIANKEGVILDANPSFRKALRYDIDEIVGQSIMKLSFLRKNRKTFTEIVRQVKSEDYWEGDFWVSLTDKQIALHMSVGVVRDEQEQILNYLAVLADVTELKTHEEQLRKVAYFDPLTKLPNRRLLDDRLKVALLQATRSHRQVAVAFLDLDGFKEVNDKFGHEEGDLLLIEIAKRLQVAVREGDTVSRVGGDEFVLLLNNIESILDCESILKRVLVGSSELIMIKGRQLQVTISIGVTLYPDDNCDADTLLRHADQSMYVAKNAGKNNYHFFNSQQELDLELRRKKLQAIQDGLMKDEFQLYFQPKIDLKNKQVIGFEALIRWIKPGWSSDLLKPMFELMEGTEQEIAMGEWVMDKAMCQLHVWHQKGFIYPISINISPNHLIMPNFCESCLQIVELYPKNLKSLLELEVLESSNINSLDKVSSVLKQIRAFDIKTALDDFGTGYSSLSHLRQLPVDYVKIDQSFVEGMLVDEEDLNMVKSIVHLGHMMNKKVIAEGASSSAHIKVLREMGCDMGQGYAIAKPMPADKVIQWVDKYHTS